MAILAVTIPTSQYLQWRPPLIKSPLIKTTSTLFSSSSSSSAAATVTQEEDTPPPSPQPNNIDDKNFRGCKSCGKEELENGCNGEGRIQGGIATVPGFGWWPIKAYRPCPGFVASGGRYRRRGQSMDEVASGRGRRKVSAEKADEAKSSKKAEGQRIVEG